MTKAELFTKYKIAGGHNTWDDAVDNWFSVEIYRRTHNEQLPPPEDTSIAWVLEFLEMTKDAEYFFSLKNPGSHFTTALRMVYKFADEILKEINAKEDS